MLYIRFPPSLCNVEDLLHERGIEISHETVRYSWNRFGPVFAAELRRKRADRMRGCKQWRWHLDEVFVKINGVTHYLWRAVDHEGEVLESVVTKTRDRKAALKFLKKSMKRHGQPENVVTDHLRAYGAALKDLGRGSDREMGRWMNNRAENSHLPFRRRERAMLAVPVHATIAEVRVRPCLCPQRLSDGAPTPKPRPLQAVTRRRSRRAARPSCGLIADRGRGQTETVWHLSDRTATCP
jgi:transposase-like protein